MNYLFETKEAEEALLSYIEKIEETGFFDDEKKQSTKHYIEEKGLMLGLLVVKTQSGEKIYLKAFSGALNSVFSVKGFVNPCFSINEYMAVLDKYSQISSLTKQILSGDKSKIKERKDLSAKCHEELIKLYKFYNIRKESLSFESMELSKFPTGTGDCAAIKLLSYAAKKGYEILSLAEIYFGKSDDKEHKKMYSPCDEKCSLLMKHILNIDLLYSDDSIAVINKYPGLLSCPGITEKECAALRISELFPSSVEFPTVHRLDMDTSGILVFAKTREAKIELFRQFEKRETKKTYIALLSGLLKEESGEINLPIRLDINNRPYQIVDFIQGKSAKTRYERISVESLNGQLVTRVRFYPLTGRTHQLRVHSASGLKLPIVGDRLYGINKNNQRLYLHAESLSFTHPKTKERLTFTTPAAF